MREITRVSNTSRVSVTAHHTSRVYNSEGFENNVGYGLFVYIYHIA